MNNTCNKTTSGKHIFKMVTIEDGTVLPKCVACGLIKDTND